MADKHEKPCPKCGHCPTCGRSNQWNPYSRYPHWYPGWYPSFPLGVWNQTSKQNTIGGGSVNWSNVTSNTASAN